MQDAAVVRRCVNGKALHKTRVGASLLAKAVGQAMNRLSVPTPSRAGSLPQLICA